MKKLIRNLSACTLLALSSCGGDEPVTESEARQTEKAIAVETQQVAVSTYPQLISYAATIEAWETAYITGPTGVRIDEILVDEGEPVNQGQVVAVMNAAQLAQARTQMELAKREVERLDTLVKIGSVSGQRFDQAQVEYQNARTNYENLAENTRLRANFDGVVTDKGFSEGEMFLPSADAPAILTIMKIQPVKATIHVAENFYSQVTEGLKATVVTDVFPDEEFTGTVFRKGPTINRGTRTFQVEIRIANERQLLRPGMFARVSLNLGETEGIYVPSTALVNQPGTSDQFLFVVQGDSVNRVKVKTGNRYQEEIMITSGLEAGQTIVTEGMGKLRDGSNIRAVGKQEENYENEGA